MLLKLFAPYSLMHFITAQLPAHDTIFDKAQASQ